MKSDLDNDMPECKYVCRGLFKMEKGLKIHCSKKGCPNAPKQHAVYPKQTGKTSNSTRPEDNHSPKCDSALVPQWSHPKHRIKFSSNKEKKMWQELDKVLGQGLRKMMKNESSIKIFTEFI